MNQIMVANLNDKVQAWKMKGDGSYSRMTPRKDSYLLINTL